jgi:hypothetical protein
VEVNGSAKHSSLLQYGNNYGLKRFYSASPWLQVEIYMKSVAASFRQLAVAPTRHFPYERKEVNRWNIDDLRARMRAKRGARKISGENVKVVWAKFSTLS